MISREQLKKDVVDQLFWDDRVEASPVQVEAEEKGHIRLSGVVPNYTAFRAAESDALAVRGVRAVNNELQIRHPSDLILEDKEIRTSISGALGWYPDIEASKIEVAVNAGTVTLRGTVDSFWKKIKAEELAFDTAGVVWVVNELAVVPTKQVADEIIAQNILAAFERSNVIDPDEVEVKVEKGLVTLSGTVSDWHAFTEAEGAAKFTSGVVNVFNHLVIRES